MDEAISLLASHGERARFIAGGTDVIVKIKEGRVRRSDEGQGKRSRWAFCSNREF